MAEAVVGSPVPVAVQVAFALAHFFALALGGSIISAAEIVANLPLIVFDCALVLMYVAVAIVIAAAIAIIVMALVGPLPSMSAISPLVAVLRH